MTSDAPVPGQWEPLDNQTEVFRVWKTEGTEVYPQIALLRVQAAGSAKFLQSPSALSDFINQNQIFPVKVRTSGPIVSLAGVGTETPSGYLFVFSHSRTSAIVVSMLPLLPEGQF